MRIKAAQISKVIACHVDLILQGLTQRSLKSAKNLSPSFWWLLFWLAAGARWMAVVSEPSG